MRYRFLRFPQGKTKAVTLSYDDGWRADIKLAEIISSYGIKGTFNISSSYLKDSERFLTPEEIREHILDKGHEVAIHGEQHVALGCIRALDGIQEVLNCRRELEKMFGRIIRGMAYADCSIAYLHNGVSYEEVRRYLQALDIAYARTVGEDNAGFELPNDWYAWKPTAHNKNPKILEYADAFTQINVNALYPASRRPRLFYMWGHSSEFNSPGGWELLDTLCQKLAHREDTWYATNIEIYNYVTAYQSLVFSADNSIAYNPTLYTIWFDADGELYEIQSGETKKLL